MPPHEQGRHVGYDDSKQGARCDSEESPVVLGGIFFVTSSDHDKHMPNWGAAMTTTYDDPKGQGTYLRISPSTVGATNNYQHDGSIFLIQLYYQIPQIDLQMSLVLI